MRTHEEIVRQYENLLQKKESLRVSISNVEERIMRLKNILRVKQAKLKEVNVRCDKLERYLYPDLKLNQTRAQRFLKLAKRILPEKLYKDMLAEVTEYQHID